MNRTDLIAQLEKHLMDNQQVADETAPGLKLLRMAYKEIMRPAANGEAQSSDLLAELNSADQTIKELSDRVSDYEDILYDLLLQAGLVPEVDGELAISYGVAVKEDPECIEKLKSALLGGELPDDATRFIAGVRNLLGLAYDVSLQEVFNTLTREAQRLNSLDAGIAQRDKGLQNMESMINKCLESAGMDWQDVDDLPDAIARLRQGENTVPSGFFDTWAQEAIDLAHAVRGDLSPENRVMAKAAERIILSAPRSEA